MQDLQNIDDQPLGLKIVVVGSIGSGKTSFVRRYVHQHFQTNYKVTIAVDFSQKRVKLPKTKLQANVNIWDLAGDDRYGSVSSIYFRNAVGVIIVFDVTRPVTVNEAIKWYNSLPDYFREAPVPPVMFIANKIDLHKRTNYNDVEGMVRADVNTPVTEKKVIGVVETSTKDDIGVREAMKQLLEVLEVRENLYDITERNEGLRVRPKLDDSCCA